MKEITIGVYQIKSESDVIYNLDFAAIINSALESIAKAKERLMPLVQEQDDESDLILGFKLNQAFLFGSFVRLNAGVKTTILSVQLDEQNVDINTIITEADENLAGAVQDPSFFCIYNDILTLTNSQKNRSRLETYLNWFFREKTNNDVQITLEPMIKTASAILLKDISSITISEQTLNNTETRKISTTKKQIIDFLKSLILDSKSKKELDYDEVFSANILIKINKKALKKGNNKQLATLLKVLPSDDIIIYDNKGNKISANSYFLKFRRKIEKTEKGYYNQQQIETEMRKIIKEGIQNEMDNED